MAHDWSELAATLAGRHDYDATIGDPHYGATAPLAARTCRCDVPNLLRDDEAEELRCWKCGAVREAARC